MSETIIAELKQITALAGVPDDQLNWLIESSHLMITEEGERFFNADDPVNRTFFVLEGKFRICTLQAGKLRTLVEFEKGAITGYLPFSRVQKAIGYGECIQKGRMLVCPDDAIKQGVKLHYELTEALVHIMTNRVRDFTASQQQQEKMFALGKLSAGLAHELNNPAAAIVRGASAIKQELTCLSELFSQIAGLSISPEGKEQVSQFIRKGLPHTAPALSMLQAASLEDDINDWLDDKQIDNFQVAETLIDFGYTLDDLETFSAAIPRNELDAVLSWINYTLVTYKLSSDISESSQRISDLVGSVKNFTYMDREADRQSVDVHDGIRSTLIIMGYKLKKGNVKVVENYDASLPQISAMPGQLNQVWTNIIDNALDAMEGTDKPTLQISTQHDSDFIQVIITDNGPGITPDLQEKIFDPFFTTKSIGKGTGLGLDVVSRIIRQHNGSIKVSSEPGHTEFEICLPITA